MNQVARHGYRQHVRKSRQEQAILPDTGKSWRYARKNDQFYYDYDRIPAARRALLPPKDALLRAAGETQAQVRCKPLREAIDEALQASYQAYMVHYGACSDDQCRALARAAAVLVAVRREQVRRGCGERKMELFYDTKRILEDIGGVQYFPSCHRTIKKKVLDERPAYEVIQLPRRGNQNSKKYDDPSAVAMLLMMRNDPRNDTNAHIKRRFRKLMTLADRPCPSESWMDAKLAENATKFLTSERFGSGRYAHQWRTYVPVKGAAYAGDCWQMDATRINFQAHKTPDGRDKCLFITVVYDVYSRDVVGYAINTVENRHTYIEALDMACNYTGYLPYEIVTDRFPGHNTEEWEHITRRMEARGTKVTVTSTKTGKALNERFFSTLQSVFLAESDMFYGEGIQSKRLAAHRSPEYKAAALRRAKREGWDQQAAIKELVPLLEAYRDTPMSDYSKRYATIKQSPRQLHNESDKPSVAKMDDLQRIDLFCMEKSLQIRNVNLIQTTVNHEVYHYRIQNYETYRNHRRVRVAYDPRDMTRVHLFEDSDAINRAYLGEAIEERGVERYGRDADREAAARAQAKARQAEELRAEEMRQQELAAAELAMQYPLITDKETLGDAETLIIERMQNSYPSARPRVLASEPDEEEIEITGPDPGTDFRAALRAQMNL